jgi:catechol 2,3-dioxygenase-like lactoylglutathione lyase family enzyme
VTDIDDSMVNVRYLVDDVQASIDFYTTHFGFAVRTAHVPAFADVAAEMERLRGAGVHFRSDVVSGPGGQQIVLDDPSGNPVELFTPAG